MTIVRLDASRLRERADEFAELLVDTVAGGASVGFLGPLDPAEAAAWWRERAAEVAAGQLAVWAADDGDRLVGTVGLAFAGKANSRHRGEVVKLMVRRDGRGRGIGRRLLATAEQSAAESGITLLHLDTETGSLAERLYGSAGWTRLGAIPDYAAAPGGELRPTTIYYKRLPGAAGTAPTR
ncbi:Acetyltransferase [Streptomyces sp. enrichment culture]|uniref:GNAT family N-acetyltransferase n=1 Tax=Streptomyces sp. enrichment culture TaxID=1795815 RepID=UPI003F55D7DA